MHTFSASKRQTSAAVLAAALSLALGACGSGSPTIAHLGSPKTAGKPPKSKQSGSGGPSTSGSGGPGSRASSSFDLAGPGGSTKALAFSRCMRSHGVANFPDPTGNGAITITPASGINPRSQQFQQAQTTCAKRLGIAGGSASPAQQAKALASALKFSRCMRSHGVPKFPDPQTGNGGVSLKLDAGTGIDPSSPVFQAAQRACQPNPLSK
jgi:hypothetical protein